MAGRVLASVTPAKDWIIRLGAFRSVFDQKTSYANLLGVRWSSGDQTMDVDLAVPDYARQRGPGGVVRWAAPCAT